MKIKLLLIGKTDSDILSNGVDDYLKRIKHYIPFEMSIIPDLKNTKNLSESQQKQKEGELILNFINPGDFLVLLDEKGKVFTSVEFSRFMEKQMIAGLKNLIFIVGGPYGFSDEVYKKCNSKISLSRMTFSHQMVRLIFAEQLYRAMTIIKGEPYHHQ
ncbi:MAG: 23S rRNA (pseudouridine(1915)-N(3))-methyltransferase RlmH [Bacteroidales bacterium]|jgi:23S rRNA (pseudouridine1915-N3)-methyltransferase|nr:23S rRNA (pseudouridine(1915)-N(3))-methyltransferase RlmH [Bacteroidales bacterium]